MPLALFTSLVIVLVTTLLIDRRFRLRRAVRIEAIGRAARMNYAAVDRFGLHHRLLQSPGWHDVLADLDVKDVLYASAGGERCYILTAKARRSFDATAVRRLARIIERVSDTDTIELVSRDSEETSEDEPIYRDYVESWRVRHPAAAIGRPTTR